MTRLGGLYPWGWEQRAYKAQRVSFPLLPYLLYNMGTQNWTAFSVEEDPAQNLAMQTLVLWLPLLWQVNFCWLFAFVCFCLVLYKLWQQSKKNKTVIWPFLLIRFEVILSAAFYSSGRWVQERGYCLIQSSHGIASNRKDDYAIHSLCKDFLGTTEENSHSMNFQRCGHHGERLMFKIHYQGTRKNVRGSQSLSKSVITSKDPHP